MAHTLLPVAGRSKHPKTEEFSFHTVRELRRTKRFGCEGNIPQYLYAFKCTDPTQDEQCPQQQQQQQHPQQQYQYHYQQQQQQQQQLQYPLPQFAMPSQTPFQPNPTNMPFSHPQAPQAHVSHLHHSMNVLPGGFGTGDTMKRPTVPMSNCQPLKCCGGPCACQAPESGLWGQTPYNLSTCDWKQGRMTSQMRVPDPQVVRPHDKSLPEDMRPTGLATSQSREPPEHLKHQCIGSLCTLCGPRTVECCPGYNQPQNYMLAKMG